MGLYDGKHQDGDYQGPVGHEQKTHKTHFQAGELKLRKVQDNGYEWIEVKPGRWIRAKKEERNA